MNHPTNPQAWAEANRTAAYPEARLPLPGLYPCLTIQANVTLHRATGLGKFVLVMREPSDHVEVARAFQDLEPWGSTAKPALRAFETMLADVGTLMGLSGRLYE